VLRKASGLSEDDFEAFVRDCELEFNYQIPGSQNATTQDSYIFENDLRYLTENLFSAVASPERIIEMDRSQILTRMGWKERFEFRSRHDFPVDETLYQPIEATEQQLATVLDELSGGYIALLGTPGSGKSTLLTKILRSRTERIIRYYAYVPDSSDPQSLRGESASFLHDVVLALERQGFQVGQSASQIDRDQLLNRFHHQLDLLHNDWQSTGRKTVILIDGLDHIAREQRPRHSLLDDLPPPSQVPEGVIIILGSQTDGPFPARVQASVRSEGRRIEMAPLGREEVFKIIDSVGLQVTYSTEHKEQIYTLSDGHPLALTYLLNRLQPISDADAFDEVLHNTERFEGDIEPQYHSYWREVEDDDELTYLLGMIARMRGLIDLAWVETWAGYEVVGRLRRRLAHYFRFEDNGRWYFFHNSFRLFLTDRTAESRPGVVDSNRHLMFHQKLADRCSEAPDQSHWAWEELYHRAMAEQHDAVLELANQDWFRRQFFAFRPVDAIATDIKVALQSASVREDPIAIARLVLIGSEMAQRGYYLQEIDLTPTLVRLVDSQIVAEHVREGSHLRLGPQAALNASIELKDAGLSHEAQRIFELAEPLDQLAGSAPIPVDSVDGKIDILETWADAASRFRDISEVIRTIQRLRSEADRINDWEHYAILTKGAVVVPSGPSVDNTGRPF
jgi:hypothetical protein